MTNAKAVDVLTQGRDVIDEMRRITPTDGEISEAQRKELRRLYRDKAIPLTAKTKELVKN